MASDKPVEQVILLVAGSPTANVCTFSARRYRYTGISPAFPQATGSPRHDAR
jgi:hypothetical protein